MVCDGTLFNSIHTFSSKPFLHVHGTFECNLVSILRITDAAVATSFQQFAVIAVIHEGEGSTKAYLEERLCHE